MAYGCAEADADFVVVLSDLLRSIGTAIQEHESLVAEAFGREMLLQVTLQHLLLMANALDS